MCLFSEHWDYSCVPPQLPDILLMWFYVSVLESITGPCGCWRGPLLQVYILSCNLFRERLGEGIQGEMNVIWENKEELGLMKLLYLGK